ncbi:glycine/D-amino acid oxidase-like deaminating enzyme [Xanthomonas translucens]
MARSEAAARMAAHDDVPIAAPPRHPHAWRATTRGMLGISMNSTTGQPMADLIAGQPPAIDTTPYRVECFT